MKRILSMLLAVTMLFSLGLNAFASDLEGEFPEEWIYEAEPGYETELTYETELASEEAPGYEAEYFFEERVPEETELPWEEKSVYETESSYEPEPAAVEEAIEEWTYETEPANEVEQGMISELETEVVEEDVTFEAAMDAIVANSISSELYEIHDTSFDVYLTMEITEELASSGYSYGIECGHDGDDWGISSVASTTAGKALVEFYSVGGLVPGCAYTYRGVLLDTDLNVVQREETTHTVVLNGNELCEMFPDEIFRYYVINNFDIDRDGVLSEAEITEVTCIDIDGIGIHSLEGIKYFTSLIELDCENNQLQELDVSGCTGLYNLYCDYNHLISLNVSGCTGLSALYCDNNQLTSLDITSCTNLTALTCGYNQLTSLNISSCNGLSVLNCQENQLTSLDITSCPVLMDLWCDNNQLTSLDISNCTELRFLNAGNNQIMSLDVDRCPHLVNLYCESNRLTTLDASNHTELKDLNCYDNQIANLDVNDCANLEWLLCNSNQLTELDISGCPYLIDVYLNETDIGSDTMAIHINYDRMVGLKFDKGITILTGEVEENIAIDEENFPDVNFRTYVSNNFDTDNDNYLSRTEIEAVTAIDVNEKGISSLEGIKYFTSLIELHCDYNQLTSLDVSGCTRLCRLYCGDNQIINLNINGCTRLQELACGNNQIESLDINNCPELINFVCWNNKLTELDISNCPNLAQMHCGGNQITNLDLSSCPYLWELGCDNNQLILLDVDNCPMLSYLNCRENQISNLSVSNCPNLRVLFCSGNQLVFLDASGHAELEDVDCSDNPLTTLKINGCNTLNSVWCENAELTSLDISNCPNLRVLFCADNQLIELDISGCPYLTELYLNYKDIGYETTSVYEKDEGQRLVFDKGITIITEEVEENIAIDEENFPDPAFRVFVSSNYDANHDDVLNAEEISAITVVNCSGNTEITSLVGMQYFTSVTAVNLQGCTGVESFPFTFGKSPITTLNLSGCTGITEQLIQGRGYANLTNLDLSGCTALTTLIVDGTALSELDLSTCSDLTMLRVSGTPLTNLNLSGLTALTQFGAQYNSQLTDLDVSGCANLSMLSCIGNPLSRLNITGCGHILDAYRNGQKETNEEYNRVTYTLAYGEDSNYSLVINTDAEIVTGEDHPATPTDLIVSYDVEESKIGTTTAEIMLAATISAETAQKDCRVGIQFANNAEFKNSSWVTDSPVGEDVANHEYLIPLNYLTPGVTYYYRAFIGDNQANVYVYEENVHTFTTKTGTDGMKDLSSGQAYDVPSAPGGEYYFASAGGGLYAAISGGNYLYIKDAQGNAEGARYQGTENIYFWVKPGETVYLSSSAESSNATIRVAGIDEVVGDAANNATTAVNSGVPIRFVAPENGTYTFEMIGAESNGAMGIADFSIYNWSRVTSGSCSRELAKGQKVYFNLLSAEGLKVTEKIALETPKLEAVTNESGKVKVTWNAVSGAEKYRVFRKEGSDGWTKIADVTGTSYTDTAVKAGITYSYTVCCISSDGETNTSGYDDNGLTITIPLETPKLTKAENVNGGVQVTWEKVERAEKYRVYRKTGSNSWSKLTDTTDASYTDKTVSEGTTYKYTVRCFSGDGSNMSGYDGDGLSIKYIAAPVLSKLDVTVSGGITVEWKASKGAAKYRVFRKTGSGKWSNLADTTELTYTDNTAETGTKYAYTVRCITSSGKSNTSAYDTTGKTITLLAAPTPSVTNTNGGVKLQWSTVSGAAKYRVFRINAQGTTETIGDTTNLNYTDKTVTGGNGYQYYLRCVSKDGTVYTSGRSKNSASIQYIPAPTLSSAKEGYGSITVTWKKAAGASKYRVYRKTSSGGWTKLGDTSKLTYTDKTAEAGNSYSYTVRGIGSTGDLSAYDTTGKTVAYVGPPVITKLQNVNGGVEITWTQRNGVKYRVIRKEGSSVKKIVDTYNGSYTDTTVKSGTTYKYVVYFLEGENVVPNVGETEKSIYYVAAPTLKSVSLTTGGISISWSSVDCAGADSKGSFRYIVWRKKGNEWTQAGMTQMNGATSCIDEKVSWGETYEYKVQVIRVNKGFLANDDIISANSNTKSIKYYLATPTLSSAEGETGTGIKITWKKVSYAEKYRVFRKEGSGSWKKVGDTTKTSYTDKTAKPGIKYTYTVRCLGSDGNFASGYNTTGKTASFKLKTPAISSISSTTKGQVVIKWGKVTGAEKYWVFRLEGNTTTKLAETTGTSYTDKTAKSGKTYEYKVRCVGGETGNQRYTSDGSAKKSITVK